MRDALSHQWKIGLLKQNKYQLGSRSQPKHLLQKNPAEKMMCPFLDFSPL
jgi:hypothetical protein